MGKGTSIPNRAVEYSSVGAGGVREYKLSAEELEEIRRKYPATKRDIAFKKPVAHNPNADRLPAKRRNQKAEEEQNMTGQRMSKEGPSSGLTKQIFLEQIASGETVASVEKAWGMKYNTLPAWVKKWELKGINPAKAQELLASGTPKETQLPRDKEAQPLVDLPELYKKAQQEIEELRAELDQTTTGRDEYRRLLEEQYEFAQEYFKQNELLKARADGAVAAREAAELDLDQATKDFDEQETALKTEILSLINKVENVRAQAERENDRLAECLSNAEMERDTVQAQLNRLITERDDLAAEVEDLRDDIRRLREIQTLAVPEPASGEHLLDRSIADLTRAKWILNRLSASGE